MGSYCGAFSIFLAWRQYVVSRHDRVHSQLILLFRER